MKFGVREICDVVLKAKANQKIGNKIFYKHEPVIYFDTLKTSSMEGAATTVYAQGGRGNSRLVAWEGERTVTFTMEDALISPAGFMILSGAGLIDATEKAIKVIRDRHNILPVEINKNSRILHLVIHNFWNREWKVVEELTEKMSQIAGRVDELRDPGPERIVPLAKSREYDLIICSVLESPEYGLQSAKLCGNMSRNMMLGWMKYGTPTVFIGHNSVCFVKHPLVTMIDCKTAGDGFKSLRQNGVLIRLIVFARHVGKHNFVRYGIGLS